MSDDTKRIQDAIDRVARQPRGIHVPASSVHGAPKHSPGPWEWYCGFTEPRFYKLRASDSTVVLESYDPDALITVGEADAALIARAPEMLSLLRELEPVLREACDESGPLPRPELLGRLVALLEAHR